MNIDKIILFEADINKIYKKGYIRSISYMKNSSGVELSLPSNISKTQATKIANYIKTKYKLRACFYVKNHGINVYYNE
jgi:ribosomal protein S8